MRNVIAAAVQVAGLLVATVAMFTVSVGAGVATLGVCLFLAGVAVEGDR